MPQRHGVPEKNNSLCPCDCVARIHMSAFPFKRIIVVGVTSSGKSTLAETIAKRFNMKFIDLDALHWEPGWQSAALDVFRERVENAIQTEQWVVAGNYHVVRDLIWPEAEAVIWLDYPLLLVLKQLTQRTFRRWWTQELLWGTNIEPFSVHFKLWSTDSLFHWLFRTYWRRKREYPMLFAQREYRHLKVIRLKHPRETQRWLEHYQYENQAT